MIDITLNEKNQEGYQTLLINTSSYVSKLSSAFDNRYILTSSTSYVLTSSAATQAITGSLFVVGDFSSSGQGIFNTGYKSQVLQYLLSSSFLSGNTSNNGFYGVVLPWSGSIAGMSLIALTAQPNAGSSLYVSARVNGVAVSPTLTASSVLVNPYTQYSRGNFAFNSGGFIDFSVTSTNFRQAAAAINLGYLLTIWAYI